MGTRRILSKAAIPKRCTRQWLQPWKIACSRSATSTRRLGKSGKPFRPRWPMVILRSPKGWTAPREVEGHYLEGFWRAHQIPLTDVATDASQFKILENWLWLEGYLLSGRHGLINSYEPF